MKLYHISAVKSTIYLRKFSTMSPTLGIFLRLISLVIRRVLSQFFYSSIFAVSESELTCSALATSYGILTIYHKRRPFCYMGGCSEWTVMEKATLNLKPPEIMPAKVHFPPPLCAQALNNGNILPQSTRSACITRGHSSVFECT